MDLELSRERRDRGLTDDELEYARRVVAAFEEAQVRGDGAIAVGGQLVDLPIVMRAQRLLDADRGES